MGSNKGLAKWQRRPPPRLPHMMGKKEKARSVCAVIGPFTASHPRSTHDSVRVPMRVPVSSIPDLFCIHARCEQESTATMYSCDLTTFTVPGAGPSYTSLGHVTRDSNAHTDSNFNHFRGLGGFPRVLRVHDGPCGTPCSVSCSVHGPPCPGHFECHTSRFDPEILGLCHSVRIDVGRRVRSHSSRAATFAVHVQS